ncbi:MAG: aminoacyl-tRNA hydrolase [Ruminococcaceae bacterium]|nr:aminoacyl-tRNA hydrolase [Oscillospiraceae bacterium]
MANIFDLFKKIESSSTANMPITHIVVGLGNVGKEYENTRHNAGFIAIDALAEKYGARIDRVKFHALVSEATVAGKRVLLMKPTTYMNNSGIAISEAAAFYKIAPENVIVLHDEISFDVGVMRIRRKGSAGGHNGLKSIIAHLSSDAFPRVKIGVGKKPSPEYDLVDFVLGKFSSDDLAKLKNENADIIASVELMLDGKIEEAMNKYSK